VITERINKPLLVAVPGRRADTIGPVVTLAGTMACKLLLLTGDVKVC